jgi:hypothetical protein
MPLRGTRDPGPLGHGGMTSCFHDSVTPFVRWCVRLRSDVRHRVNLVTGVNVVNGVTESMRQKRSKGAGPGRARPLIAARRAPPTLVAAALRLAGRGVRNGFANRLVYPTCVRCAHSCG